MGIKFDAHKFKIINDLTFVLIEKILLKFYKLHHLYFDFYDEMTDNEIKIANISKDDNILHIGSGPIPATPILLARKTKAKITGVDNNLKSVNQSKLLVSKYNLSDQVEIIHAEVQGFSIKNYNIVLISQGIKPRREIIEYISKSIDTKTKVIFRTTSLIDGKLSNNDLFLKDFFDIKKIVSNKKNGLLISILMTKKPTNTNT